MDFAEVLIKDCFPELLTESTDTCSHQFHYLLLESACSSLSKVPDTGDMRRAIATRVDLKGSRSESLLFLHHSCSFQVFWSSVTSDHSHIRTCLTLAFKAATIYLSDPQQRLTANISEWFQLVAQLQSKPSNTVALCYSSPWCLIRHMSEAGEKYSCWNEWWRPFPSLSSSRCG